MTGGGDFAETSDSPTWIASGESDIQCQLRVPRGAKKSGKFDPALVFTKRLFDESDEEGWAGDISQTGEQVNGMDAFRHM